MTINLATQNTTRLPADTLRVATVMGAKILATLDRLGFVHQNQDGTMFTLRFSEAHVWCENGQPAILTYTIDPERMWHFSPVDIAKPRVVARLEMTCQKPTWIINNKGLVIAVELTPGHSETRLPARIELDLSSRPGEMMIPLGVGRDGPVWQSIQELGHILIAGTSGSGKTTWLHSAIAAMVCGATPERLRLALIDLKRTEMAQWANVPHVIGELAYTVEQATQVLGELVNEINQRGDLITAAGARDLSGYNKVAAEKLPFIVCIVDEALDLVSSAGARSDLAGRLKTIAMRGRGMGVYLWMATQHAAAVTGLPRVVNVNLATRLVFRVLDGSAALAAGCPGAQDIPKNRPGRLLAKLNDKPVMLQGYALRDCVLKSIANAVSRVATKPAISEREAALVRYAVEHLGGAFVINRLNAARLDGWSEWGIRKLAETWEARGWLTQPHHKGASRRVTPELAMLAGVTMPSQPTHSFPHSSRSEGDRSHSGARDADGALSRQ